MAISMWKKVVAGGARKSRLHDERGKFVSFTRLLRNGPKAAVTTIGRVAFDRRDVRPWISYDAQREIDRFLKPTMRVLEFGSGMSTAWYAARSIEVVSVEDYKPWFDKVSDIFRERGVSNVVYKFAADEAAYLALTTQEIGERFDFVMIDGSHRDRCVDVAISVLKPGGWIYLDNADKGPDTGLTGNCVLGSEKLIAFAKKVGGTFEWFVDFSPTQFFVQTGLLIRT